MTMFTEFCRKFRGPKTGPKHQKFRQLGDLIANISGTKEDIVKRKIAITAACVGILIPGSRIPGSRDPNTGIPGSQPIFSIPNPGIGDAWIPGFRDYEKWAKCPNFAWHLPEKYFFPEFWGQLKGSVQKPDKSSYMFLAINHGNDLVSLRSTIYVNMEAFR